MVPERQDAALSGRQTAFAGTSSKANFSGMDSRMQRTKIKRHLSTEKAKSVAKMPLLPLDCRTLLSSRRGKLAVKDMPLVVITISLLKNSYRPYYCY